MACLFAHYIFVAHTLATDCSLNVMQHLLSGILTDGLFGKPTRWPHVVNKLTKHSRTRDCDSHGLFHPLNGAVSAGDKLALRRGEFGVPVILCDK